ncbi:Histone-lysine N-methyltransferase trithorax [Amphibalanus amphitrite]|uniref:Histone-lysine N-methyltransferase trithorax n=1 Tax=Amphibalanus amphitrite TaxID=1232801 RepID=A0A6A4W4Z5_AMPAM|nr:Histone-lysine N-methyltransferase trithorax [Amphibalanus amphitrite]
MEMSEVTVSLSAGQARRLERLSTDHGPGYMDHLLDVVTPFIENDGAPTEPPPIDEWIPKIGIDAVNRSVEIDVGSQVVVVNLADFYKKRDAAQLLGSRSESATPAIPADPATSALHLLAATATQEAGAGPKFTCVLCHAVCPSVAALRLHGAAAHCARLSVCRRCGLSYLTQRELDRHPCEEERRERQERRRELEEERERLERQKVPPLLVRPSKNDRVRRLEDTSSEDSDEPEEPARRWPSPPHSRPVAHRPPPAAPAPRPPPPKASPAAAQARRPAPPNGKKEAYVCRVCHSKFRDPKSVLNHLKQFHPEHARKAWNKFQDNLKNRQSGAAPPPAAGRGAGGGDNTFAVRSVAPMKLKLSRSAQQQRMHHAPPQRRPHSPPAPSSEPTGPPSPGFVTCGVCGGTKYYTHTASCKLDGSYACEPCRKFVSRLMPHQSVQCLLGLGRCHIPAVAPRHSAEARCRACWLKKCLLAFNMTPERHNKLRHLLPPSIARDVPEAAHKPFQQTGRCELDEP